ncbi:MAG: hypothetical protein AAFO79_10005 [Pseudomonadota bacterium]
MLNVQNTLLRFFVLFALIQLAGCGLTENGPTVAEQPRPVVSAPITTLPENLGASCNGKRTQLYDACGSQLSILKSAKARAKAEGKVVLVSYGADWCIWCHVFHKYAQGYSGTFDYTYGPPGAPEDVRSSRLKETPQAQMEAQARELNAFIAANFVLVHIDAQYAPDGEKVLAQTGGRAHYNYSLPFMYTIDERGKYAGHIVSSEVDRRRDTAVNWYRGYRRPALLAKLRSLHSKAQGAPAG